MRALAVLVFLFISGWSRTWRFRHSDAVCGGGGFRFVSWWCVGLGAPCVWSDSGAPMVASSQGRGKKREMVAEQAQTVQARVGWVERAVFVVLLFVEFCEEERGANHRHLRALNVLYCTPSFVALLCMFGKSPMYQSHATKCLALLGLGSASASKLASSGLVLPWDSLACSPPNFQASPVLVPPNQLHKPPSNISYTTTSNVNIQSGGGGAPPHPPPPPPPRLGGGAAGYPRFLQEVEMDQSWELERLTSWVGWGTGELGGAKWWKTPPVGWPR